MAILSFCEKLKVQDLKFCLASGIFGSTSKLFFDRNQLINPAKQSGIRICSYVICLLPNSWMNRNQTLHVSLVCANVKQELGLTSLLLGINSSSPSENGAIFLLGKFQMCSKYIHVSTVCVYACILHTLVTGIIEAVAILYFFLGWQGLRNNPKMCD